MLQLLLRTSKEMKELSLEIVVVIEFHSGGEDAAESKVCLISLKDNSQ